MRLGTSRRERLRNNSTERSLVEVHGLIDC